MRILAKLFWRVILPLVALLVLALERLMDCTGRSRMPYRYEPRDSGEPGVSDPFLPNTFRWGKEAEDYAAHLVEAERLEEQRRQRSNWVER